MEKISIALSVLAILISFVDIVRSYIMEKMLYLVSKHDILLFPTSEWSEKGWKDFVEYLNSNGISRLFNPTQIKVVRFGFERIYGCALSVDGIDNASIRDILDYAISDSCIYNCCKFYIITRHGKKSIRKYFKARTRSSIAAF